MEILKVGDIDNFINDIERIIEYNKEDFIVWEEYMNDGTIDDDFFWNYQTDETIVALNDSNDVVGFICYDLNSERDDIPHQSDFIYLSLVIVDEDHRSDGIGKSLIDEVLNISNEESLPVIFGTWESNKVQRHIAEKYGFKLFEKKQNHRYNGEDTLYYRYTPSD